MNITRASRVTRNVIRSMRATLRQAHQEHLRRELLDHALEEAEREGLVTRSEYNG